MSDKVVRGVLKLEENISTVLGKAKSATKDYNETVKKLTSDIKSLESEKRKLTESGVSFKGVQQANQQIKQIKDTIKQPSQMKVTADTRKAESAVASLKGKILAAASSLAIGAGVVAAFKTGIDYNKSMEQSAISWTTILKSEKEAASTMKKLVDMGASTPFEFKELDGVAKKLNMAGFGGDKLMGTLRNVGDAVSAIGGDSETLNGISTAFYQIYTKGKLSAEEMLQLGERGIPAWEILADKMGITTQELQQMTSQGKVMANDVLPLLSEGLGERFGGAMEKQSKTFSGMLTTSKDLISSLLATGTEGAFSEMTGGLKEFNKQLASNDAKKFAKEVGQGVGAVTKGIMGFLKGAWEVKEVIAAIGVAAVAFTVVKKGAEAFKAMKTGIETAKVAMQAFNTTNPVGWISLAISAIAGLGFAVKASIDKANKPITDLKDKTKELKEEIESTKKSLSAEKISMDVDFKLAEEKIATIKRMIDGKQWGGQLDMMVEDLIKKFPELEGAIIKSGAGWEIHEGKLDGIFAKIKRNAEYTYLDEGYQTAYGQQKTIEEERADPEGEYAAAVKKRDDEKANYDKAAKEYNDTPTWRRGKDGSAPVDTEYKKAQAAVDEFDKTMQQANAEVEKWKGKIETLETEQPQVLESATTTPEWVYKMQESLEGQKTAQEEINRARGELEKGTLEAFTRVADWIEQDPKGKNEDEEDFKARITEALNAKQEEVAKNFASEQTKIVADTLNTYKDTLTTSQTEVLGNYQSTLTDVLAGGSEGMGSAIEWLQSFKLPVDVKVDVSGTVVNVSETGTNGGNKDSSTKSTNTNNGKTTTATNNKKTGKNAEGTNYWHGGETFVGERGTEKVELPRGSKVTPAFKSSPSAPNISVNINMGGVVVREEADIEKIAQQLAAKISIAAMNMA